MITADQIVVHLLGDYVVQSDWMANEKTKRHLPALVHALTYTACFLFLTTSIPALLVIGSTHFLIDRYRLARYACWAKNFLQPPHPPCACTADQACHQCDVREFNHPWSECSVTGYHRDRPAWLTVWLLIINDNTFHLIINGAALYYL